MEGSGMRDFEDVIGEATPQRSDRVRRAEELLDRLTTAKRRDAIEEGTANVDMLHAVDALHGVTVGWLSNIFRMDPTTIKKKLRDCNPIQRRKAGYVYDLKNAAQYLVKPVFDVDQVMRQMKPSELPTHLQDAYWSAMRSKQKWEEEAGHLWRTERVMEVLGEVFQQIKFAVQLWPDHVRRAEGLTTAQRETLIQMGDALQADIHKRLMELPMKSRTESTREEHQPEPMPKPAKVFDLDDVI